MIDLQARSNLAQQRQSSELMQGMKDAIVSGLKAKSDNGEASDVLKLVFKKEEDNALLSAVQKIGSALTLIYTQIKKPIALPKILNVTGKVEVTKQPPIRVTNMDDLGKYFQSLEQKLAVWAQAASTAQPPHIEFPKLDFPKNDPIDLSPLTDGLLNLEKAFKNQEKSTDTAILRRLADTMAEYTSRPTLTTPPVTNVNLNGLQGFPVSTVQTVGTSAVTLPSYGQLFNRRSMIVFNNSSNTLYLGGSNVTVANGLPVLSQSYSPAIDAGYDMVVYGISTGASNIRVFEVSKDQTANVQE